MGDIFKLKINFGDANIELEGEGTLVHTILSELRELGLGKLTTGQQMVPKSFVLKNNDNLNVSNSSENTNESDIGVSCALPNIRDIVIKDLPKTEAEWLLVYALYTCQDNIDTFTADDLRQKYHDTNRYTENRNKNFSTNLKKAVTESWFICINETDYSLSEAGRTYALEIIKRSPEPAKAKNKKTVQTHAKTTYQLVDLGIDQTAREELKKYVESFKSLNNMELSLVISAWLKTNANVDEVNEHIIYTALKSITHSTSFDIKASLKNAKNSKNYFISGENTGFFIIHHIGEDYVRELENKRDN